ncbi:hypothetical protein ACLOJK_036741, partial [Asimina triloba]
LWQPIELGWLGAENGSWPTCCPRSNGCEDAVGIWICRRRPLRPVATRHRRLSWPAAAATIAVGVTVYRLQLLAMVGASIAIAVAGGEALAAALRLLVVDRS